MPNKPVLDDFELNYEDLKSSDRLKSKSPRKKFKKMDAHDRFKSQQRKVARFKRNTKRTR